MRTKTAVLTAALVAAGAISSIAQNVYSVNVVGYVNVPVQANKFYLIENPLNKANSGGNAITNVLQFNDTWDQTIVYPWAGSTYGAAETFYAGFGWFPGTTSMAPGAGFFLYSTTNSTITFVGEVVTGATNTLPGGFTIAGSSYPASLDLTTLGLTGQDQDIIYRFNPATQSYLDASTFYAGYGWFDGSFPGGTGGPVNGPSLNVGEGVFYYNANTPFSWKQNFVIQ